MTLPRLKFPTRDDRAVDLPVRQTSHMVMLVLILLFGFALRVFDLEYMPPFAHYDGINLAEYSVKVLRGEVPLYGVRLDGDPNWAFAQFAPYLLFGGNLWALRVTTALWSVLVLSVAYFGVRQMFGARVAIAATFLMTAGHVFIHFSREATIVLPSVLTSFLTIGLYLKAQRQGGRARYALFGLAGAALAVNLYEYAAAKSVFFAVAALWLFAVPHRKRDWSAYLRDTACFAFGFVIVATPILWWYLQRPADLFDRLGFLSIFHPRNAAINQRLYGQVDTLTLLYHQTLRSLGGFFVFWDTSPNYHFESALLDPATAILMIPGLCIALLRKPKLTAIILVWMAAGLIAGAILLIEPPTSYHYRTFA